MELEKLVDVAAAGPPCPACGTRLEPTSVRVAGLAVVVETRCPDCGGAFVSDWPAGHALLHPVVVDQRAGAVYSAGFDWYARRFVRCLNSITAPACVAIAVEGRCRQAQDAILVNCLDFFYSHALLKLLSAARHMRESPDDDVVVIVPRVLRWLVPRGAVAIVVDLPFACGDRWVVGLDATVEKVLAPSRSVRISPAVSQPDVTSEDLALLGEDIRPRAASAAAAGPVRIGFSLRDDRLWLGRPSLRIKVLRRLPLRPARALLLRRQHRNYSRLASLVRERHPEAHFVAFGIGRTGGLANFVEDIRMPGPLQEERLWLDAYRACRVVVGVHGANLLLPSLLSGAVVDLMPSFKLPNVNQDLILLRERAAEPKEFLFQHRTVPEECTPETVAATVSSIIEDAEFHRRNIVENRKAYEAPGWPHPISWRQIELDVPVQAPAGLIGVGR